MIEPGLRALVDRSDRHDLSIIHINQPMTQKLLTNGKSLSTWFLPVFENCTVARQTAIIFAVEASAMVNPKE